MYWIKSIQSQPTWEEIIYLFTQKIMLCRALCVLLLSGLQLFFGKGIFTTCIVLHSRYCKGCFTWYDFVAYNLLTTRLRHILGHDYRKVLEHVLKSYDIFSCRKQVACDKIVPFSSGMCTIYQVVLSKSIILTIWWLYFLLILCAPWFLIHQAESFCVSFSLLVGHVSQF